jgi:parallel beta-helix repeat protein
MLIYKYINIANKSGVKHYQKQALGEDYTTLTFCQLIFLYYHKERVIWSRYEMDRDTSKAFGKMIRVYILGILICSSVVFVYSVGCLATATTLYVDDSNTVGPWDGTQEHPYQRINDGITAANPGDTVFVSNGTYTEHVVITKNLTLTGENKETTFIDGGASGRALYLLGSDTNHIWVDVSGFTIQNAGGGGNACVACLYVINGTVTNNKMIKSIEGDGIQLTNCQRMTISNNLISGNKMVGISAYISKQNIIKNNILEDNQKGIYLYYSNSNEITGNTIQDNSVYGVSVVQSWNNVFSHNDFVRNEPQAQESSSNSTVNLWSKNGQGNYWDDYTGYDNNSDGIGDIPYNIPGGSNQDLYPLGYFRVSTPPGNQIPVAYTPSIVPTIAFVGDSISMSGDGTDSDGTIVGYSWRSNIDGALSIQQSFTTQGLSIGTHTIYFKVQDNDGAWSLEKTASVTINARANHAPTASIDDITPNPALFGHAVLFHGHGTDVDGTITSYQWSSSKDGVIGSAATCVITNLTSGTHLIYFKVKDNMNEWSSPATMTLVIQQNTSQDPSNVPPIANIGGPYHGTVNETILFNASRSSDSDGSIRSYDWDFGDNSSGTGPAPTHVYASPGVYQVTVRVTDDDGASSRSSSTISITQTSSQGEAPSSTVAVAFNIPFPAIVVAMIVSMILIFVMFIRWMKKR